MGGGTGKLRPSTSRARDENGRNGEGRSGEA